MLHFIEFFFKRVLLAHDKLVNSLHILKHVLLHSTKRIRLPSKRVIEFIRLKEKSIVKDLSLKFFEICAENSNNRPITLPFSKSSYLLRLLINFC